MGKEKAYKGMAEVKFDIQLGSDYQREFFQTMLVSMMRALKEFLEGSHRNNKVYYTISYKDKKK